MSIPRAAMSVATSTRMEPSLNPAKRRLPGGLGFVPVDGGGGGDAGAGQVLGDAVGPVLGAGKHQGRRDLVFSPASPRQQELDLLPLSTR